MGSATVALLPTGRREDAKKSSEASMRSRIRRSGAQTAAGLPAIVLGLLLLAPAPPAPAADEPAGEVASVPDPQDAPPPAPEEPDPAVDLDRLLRLPNSYEADVDRRGGATASEWRARFGAARKEAEDARTRLATAEAELEKASGTSSAWQVSAPGTSDPQTSPISLRLREQIRSEREAITAAERRLRALDVEADLAAVPPDWREPAKP